jgi:hypothetical protein
MKITAARLIVCSPDRSFVTLRIETDGGIYGLGDATLNGRELAVASYLEEHVIPCLIGRDPFQTGDIWQYLYREAYWRCGLATMSAIAAVDVALWDIKGKALNTPVYNLLGGKSREGNVKASVSRGFKIYRESRSRFASRRSIWPITRSSSAIPTQPSAAEHLNTSPASPLATTPPPNAHFSLAAASTSSGILYRCSVAAPSGAATFFSRTRPARFFMSNLRSLASVPALLLAGFLLASAALQVRGQAGPSLADSYPPVVHLSSEQDHQRTMDLLHMTSIRRGRDGSPASPYAANNDEAKANPYPKLPDPLVLNDGKKVTTAKMWWTKRRPQIVELFDREIYGRVPAHTPKVTWEVTSAKSAMNGDFPIIIKSLTGHVDNSAYPLISVNIQLELTTPANAKGPVPVILEFGFIGPFPTRPGTPTRPIPPPPPGPTWQQQLLAKGWGYAVLVPNSVQADNGAGLTEGIIGLCNHGQSRSLDDWGALRAWAWGASQALDYFQNDKSVNAKQVGITGHSRYGKAAIVTMAYDQRFAIAYVSSSGEGGAKLSRRNFGETVENVAGTSEYHWMAGNFLKYAGTLQWNDLPVDAHELITLCAPRPVFIGAGATTGDGWVDAGGMFMAEAAAGPVYRLLGEKGLGTDEFPPITTSITDGNLGFRQHTEGHTPLPNWPTFILFASRFLRA